MILTKLPIILALTGVLVLAGCANPNLTERSNIQQGGVGGNGLSQQESDLRRDLDNDAVQISNLGDSLVVSLPQDMLFAPDSFVVDAGARDDLLTVAAHLKRYPNSTVQVVGHTDSNGAASNNQLLSERQAAAVGDILIDARVPAPRLQTIGKGESQPVASNLTEPGKAKNRRVEIIIVPSG